jgi:hypothetical protein
MNTTFGGCVGHSKVGIVFPTEGRTKGKEIIERSDGIESGDG